LPVPGERPEQERAYLAPRTPTEEAVARIWAEVLGLDRVGVHDNFFELGGHSLLLVQLHSRLQERFGAGLSLADLFGFPTLGDLARRLEGSAEAAAKGEEARDESVERAEARRARMVRRRPPRPGAGPAWDDSDDSDD
ncbi:MAG TPA: phosphopantetheine-binding protein, partial [Longimicrobiaceae bacterium]